MSMCSVSDCKDSKRLSGFLKRGMGRENVGSKISTEHGVQMKMDDKNYIDENKTKAENKLAALVIQSIRFHSQSTVSHSIEEESVKVGKSDSNVKR